MLSLPGIVLVLGLAQPDLLPAGASFADYDILNTRVERLGNLSTQINEASGIAVSRADNNRIWLVNDSGDQARLYAVDRRGRLRKTVSLIGAANVDWEDLATFVWNGEPWLAVADIGDNDGIRSALTIYLLRDPATLPSRLRREAVIRFSLPGGPVDCEGLAVDPHSETIFVINKRGRPYTVYSLPLATDAGGTLQARPVAALPQIPPPTDAMKARRPALARWLSQPTSMDVDPEGNQILVSTYTHGFVFRRQARQSWSEALAGRPRVFELTGLKEPEAVAFDTRSTVVTTSEKMLPAPLIAMQIGY